MNRLPLSVLSFKTSYELLYGNAPNYHHLKSFGCLCFAATSKRLRTKFQPKAHACVFLGYPYGKKAYLVLDLETQKLFTTRDITFHEHIYPFHHLSIHNKFNDNILPNTTDPLQTLFWDTNQTIPAATTLPNNQNNPGSSPPITPHSFPTNQNSPPSDT